MESNVESSLIEVVRVPRDDSFSLVWSLNHSKVYTHSVGNNHPTLISFVLEYTSNYRVPSPPFTRCTSLLGLKLFSSHILFNIVPVFDLYNTEIFSEYDLNIIRLQNSKNILDFRVFYLSDKIYIKYSEYLINLLVFWDYFFSTLYTTMYSNIFLTSKSDTLNKLILSKSTM